MNLSFLKVIPFKRSLSQSHLVLKQVLFRQEEDIKNKFDINQLSQKPWFFCDSIFFEPTKHLKQTHSQIISITYILKGVQNTFRDPGKQDINLLDPGEINDISVFLEKGPFIMNEATSRHFSECHRIPKNEEQGLEQKIKNKCFLCVFTASPHFNSHTQY